MKAWILRKPANVDERPLESCHMIDRNLDWHALAFRRTSRLRKSSQEPEPFSPDSLDSPPRIPVIRKAQTLHTEHRGI